MFRERDRLYDSHESKKAVAEEYQQEPKNRETPAKKILKILVPQEHISLTRSDRIKSRGVEWQTTRASDTCCSAPFPSNMPPAFHTQSQVHHKVSVCLYACVAHTWTRGLANTTPFVPHALPFCNKLDICLCTLFLAPSTLLAQEVDLGCVSNSGRDSGATFAAPTEAAPPNQAMSNKLSVSYSIYKSSLWTAYPPPLWIM